MITNVFKIYVLYMYTFILIQTNFPINSHGIKVINCLNCSKYIKLTPKYVDLNKNHAQCGPMDC